MVDLYKRYGEDYKTPCIRFAVDSLNDKASSFSADMFFRNISSIQAAMREELAIMMLRECFCSVSSLQLSKAELPQRFEHALSETNVAI